MVALVATCTLSLVDVSVFAGQPLRIRRRLNALVDEIVSNETVGFRRNRLDQLKAFGQISEAKRAERRQAILPRA